MRTMSSIVIFLINTVEHKLNLLMTKSISRTCNYLFFFKSKPQITYSAEDRVIFTRLRIQG